jgi:hypothetical protein
MAAIRCGDGGAALPGHQRSKAAIQIEAEWLPLLGIAYDLKATFSRSPSMDSTI